MALDIGEGLRRLATTLRFAGILVAALCAILGVVSVGAAILNSNLDNALVGGGTLFFGALLLGVSYGIAWMIDGFAGKRAPDSQPCSLSTRQPMDNK